MKMSKMRMVASALLIAAVITGCKKGNGPEGPQGPSGPQGPAMFNLSTNGFITGTVVGTHRDGSPMNETFSFDKYLAESNQPAGTLDSLNPTSYYYTISRYTDIFSSNGANLYITSAGKSASSAPLNLNLNIEKLLSNNKLFRLSVYSSTATASSIVYNSSSASVTGNFSASVSGSSNNTGYPLTVTGSFQSNITQLYYIKKKVNEIITE